MASHHGKLDNSLVYDKAALFIMIGWKTSSGTLPPEEESYFQTLPQQNKCGIGRGKGGTKAATVRPITWACFLEKKVERRSQASGELV